MSKETVNKEDEGGKDNFTTQFLGIQAWIKVFRTRFTRLSTTKLAFRSIEGAAGTADFYYVSGRN